MAGTPLKGLFLLAFFLIPFLPAAAVDTGEVFPSFSVVSGDGKILIRPDLSGRNIFLFYEDRSRLDMNKDLKSYLINQDFNDREVRIIIIADCSRAGLRKKFWESQLVESSRRNGVTVYGDWNGRMKGSLSAPEETSSFYIIDTEGIVRYFKEGTVPEGEFQKIRDSIVP